MDRRTILLALCFVAIAVLLAALWPAPSPDYKQDYLRAVEDASKDHPEMIDHNLTPISDSNPLLVRNEAGRVLFVTWTSWNGYDQKAGGEMNLSTEVWVTVGRQAQEFCKSVQGDWVLRTEQKLGLPPGSNKTRFVELFIDRRDVFRPCPDPETGDAECSLSFPENVSAGHRAWFEDLRSRSYGEKGYPWTRLGYTYDWGSADHVGLTEYVVKPGSAVKVAGVYADDVYCGKAS